MNFCCIGSSPDCLGLLKEITASDRHALKASVVTDELRNAIAAASLPVQLAASSEDALHAPNVDCVIVAVNDPDDCVRLARAAAQADRHVIVFPPHSSSPALAFELHLVFDESQRTIIPVTGRWQLSALPADELILPCNANDVQQVAMDLPIAKRTTTPATVIEGGIQLRRAVVQGLDVVTATGLRYAQVTTLDSNVPDGSLLARLVTLNAPTTAERPLPPATLTIKPATTDSATELPPPVLKVINRAGVAQVLECNRDQPLLPRIEHLCASRVDCTRQLESFATVLELADAADKSLRRRRTVDVQFDTGSERGVFKSQMTAIGCGILTWMMLGLVMYLVVAALGDWPEWLLHTARILWVAPLILFLVAQFLLPLARGRSSSR